MKHYFAEHAWLIDGWHANVAFDIDAAGRFAAVVPGSEAGERERLGRWVLPGMPNLHSHAFQRAMAGLAERQSDPRDSFWTWRELMYRFAQRICPEQLQAIAAQLYAEMLEAGYTHVCEFHYLHHDRDGRPYADPATMALAIRAAAAEAGIGLTLLPVLYQTGGFDGRALGEHQRRFGNSVEQYLGLHERLRSGAGALEQLGLCFHSLRAVPEAAIREVLAALPGAPTIHIHVAEQTAEVDDCLAATGLRPVRWLLDRVGLDPRWSLIHATHLDGGEIADLAASGAVAGLCPTTEANLGDGLFNLPEYLDAGGRFGIGSDSHISVSPVEELRWLEYGQRLRHRRRNLVGLPNLSCGESLYTLALAGGAQASAVPVGVFDDALDEAGTVGARADLLVLDDSLIDLDLAVRGDVVDRWLFAGNRSAISDVMVAGHWQVRAGRHLKHEAIGERYLRTLRSLMAEA